MRTETETVPFNVMGQKLTAAMKMPADNGAGKKMVALPSLKKATVVSAAQAAQTEQEIQAFIVKAKTWITETLAAIAPHLQNSVSEIAATAISEDEINLAAVINGMPTPASGRELRNFCFGEILKIFPRNREGLKHLTAIGYAIGALENANGKRGIFLPLAAGDGKIHGAETRTAACCARFVNELHNFINEKDRLENRAEEEKLKTLGKGTVNFSEAAAATNGGETVLWAPDAHEGGKNHPGGNIRVRIAGGEIFPVAAVGHCAKIFSQVAGDGVSIPLSSVKTLTVPQGTGSFFYRKVFHDLVRRGVENFERRAAREQETASLKAAGTTPWTEWLLRGVAGTAFFFLPDGWTVPGNKEKGTRDREFRHVQFVAELREDGAIRIVACNGSATDLFPAECREFAAPGERFAGLHDPLGQILRALYGKARGINARGQIAPTVPAPPPDAAFEQKMLESAGEATAPTPLAPPQKKGRNKK